MVSPSYINKESEEETKVFIKTVDIKTPVGKFINIYGSQKFCDGFMCGAITGSFISGILGYLIFAKK